MSTEYFLMTDDDKVMIVAARNREQADQYAKRAHWTILKCEAGELERIVARGARVHFQIGGY